MKRKKRGVIQTLEPEVYTGIYMEIAAQIDCETAEKIFEMLRGQMIVFPQKLYNRDYVRAFIREHYGEYTVREISRMFGYSDRRIRQFIAEMKLRENGE